MSRDPAAVVVGALRLASGASFLASPEAANRMWGDKEEPSPTTALLLRSMGYRDALLGALLVTSGITGSGSRRWFLASAGADAADLLGGWSVHDRMTRRQQAIGMGGAAFGIAVGLWGAGRRPDRKRREQAVASDA